MKSRPLLLFCIALGVLLHGGALWILAQRSNTAHQLSLKQTPFLKSPPHDTLCHKQNHQLTEIFQNLQKASQSPSDHILGPMAEFAPPLPLTLLIHQQELADTLDIAELSDIVLDEDVAHLPEKPSSFIKNSLEKQHKDKSSNFLKALFCKEGGVISRKEGECQECGLALGMTSTSQELPFTPHDTQNASGFDIQQQDASRHTALPQDLALEPGSQSRASPPHIPCPVHAPAQKIRAFGSIASSKHFDVKVECSPKRARPGYVFKITLIPKQTICFKRIAHNYTFLLDRSNSISRARYFSGRKAIFEALTYLKPRDTFNILIFDDRVSRLSTKPLTYSPESVSKAKQFLERHSHGGIFASTDIYASLDKIIPRAISSHEVYTAILLSDGDTYLNTEQQRQTIGQWTQENRGKVSLFCAASGVGNNLPLLELIARFNKGKLIYTKEHAAMPTRLGQLMRAIQNPIGKSLSVKAVTSNRKQIVLLEPKNCRLPLLYEERPFVIFGSTNRLDEFSLFLQGRYYQKSFDIIKKIDLAHASAGTLSLETEWTSLLAQECFEHYFEEGKSSYLKQAKELLAPLNLPVPFTSP